MKMNPHPNRNVNALMPSVLLNKLSLLSSRFKTSVLYNYLHCSLNLMPVCHSQKLALQRESHLALSSVDFKRLCGESSAFTLCMFGLAFFPHHSAGVITSPLKGITGLYFSFQKYR